MPSCYVKMWWGLSSLSLISVVSMCVHYLRRYRGVQIWTFESRMLCLLSLLAQSAHL